MKEYIDNEKVIVFQVYIGSEDENETVDVCRERMVYLEAQLAFLKHCILSENLIADCFVVPTCPLIFKDELSCLVDKYGFRIFGDEFHSNNRYEYPGFDALKLISESSRKELSLCYIHSKGIVNRRRNAIGIFRLHVKLLLSVDPSEIFKKFDVNRICLFPSDNGWAWHNFFWVKSPYLRNREILLSSHRQYYESWLGSGKNGHKKCYSLMKLLDECLDRNIFSADDVNNDERILRYYKIFSI